jgi:tetratricopeptide (TPR) repeat protein
MCGSCNVLKPVIKKLPIILLLFSLLLILPSCSQPGKTSPENRKKDSLVYLNHADTARYVGMNTCRLCHQSIYNSFIKTGMGQSLDLATKNKSAGDFSSSRVYDRFADLHYRAYWDHDSLFMQEFRLSGKDTLHSRTEQVNFIIGSGQHTNSHLHVVNGYLSQMPMTYYTQKKHWDLPPGFEGGVNTRFSRKIGLECMSCHNGYPDFVLGSENKYTRIPTGIDCERCHGPGSIHVAQRQSGSRVDTAKYVDYSIVNPAKLSIDAQFDICQRCHLQGNAILKDHKSFYDFRPGQKLSDYLSVFLPKYKNADDEFIMASHADRLKQSPCFIKSYEKAAQNKNALKPYQGAMTCITCHNPHVSVRETDKNVFNNACNNCHINIPVNEKRMKELMKVNCSLRSFKPGNCVSCHMPVSGSTDIPHVSVHDHYIRKPVTRQEKNKIKTFIGLYSINEKNPDRLTRAKAYLNQYDKFEQNPAFLDSAAQLLRDKKDLAKNIHALLQLNFTRQDFGQVLTMLRVLGEQRCYDSLFVHPSYDNLDAWSCYRVGESYYNTGDAGASLRWFKKAIALAPYNLDFRNKLGSAFASLKDLKAAAEQFNFILKENPEFVQAYTNLGYISLVQGDSAEALRLYTAGLDLDPDNEALLLNLAGYYLYAKNKPKAEYYLKRVLKKNPGNQKAKMILRQVTA